MTAGSFTISRDQVRDFDALSLEAVGLLAWLTSHTDAYIAALTEDAIRAKVRIGRDKVRRLLRELAAAGYLVRRRLTDLVGLTTGVRYGLNRKARPGEMTLPLDGFSGEPNDLRKRHVSAGRRHDGFSGEHSSSQEEQEENKELSALPRGDDHGRRHMSRTPRAQLPGQIPAWPAAAPDPTPGTSVEQQPQRDLTARWIDHCKSHGVTLTPTLIKRYAAKVKELRDADIDAGLISRALHAMLLDRQVSRVALLDAYVVRVQQGPGLAPATERRSTTEDRVAAALSLVGTFEATA